MDLKRTTLAVVVAVCTVATAYGVSTQTDIDNIANNLEVKVILHTNHFVFGNHSVQFYLKNNGRSKILQNKDWVVQFSMKNKLFRDETRYTGYGLEIVPEKGCHYILAPDPATTTPFQGLGYNESTAFTVPASGLSVLRSDVYPRFIVYAGSNITPKTIRSTDSDKLDFVFIHSKNVSVMDPSLMTGIRRSIMTPDVFDEGGVPGTTVMPAPINITLGDPPLRIIRMNDSQAWYIWADNDVSNTFKTRLRDSISSLEGMSGKVFIFEQTDAVPRPPAYASLIYVVIRDKPQYTEDYYQLNVNNNNNTNFIYITAGTEKGFTNALSSLMSITGLFNVVPHLTIGDDARFGHRSVMLDVTKNFFPAETIVKFINLMSMYKLNNLVLNLADNYGWRLEMPQSMDFPELRALGSKRCFGDESQCVLPAFGSGADDNTSGSGSYSIQDFGYILGNASAAQVTVTPRINFMGSMAAAKAAAHQRYMRLKKTNVAEANRLHIMTNNYPSITLEEKSDDTCYTHGVLDPCNAATGNFIVAIVDAISDMYHVARVPLLEFHVGGDETTVYMHKFKNCNDPLRKMLRKIKGAFRPYTTLRVSEEAVTDTTTDSCLTAAQNYAPDSIIVEFTSIFPTDHNTWDLTPDQLNYLNSPVTPIVDGVGTDPLKPVNFTRKGDAPWSKAYKCANMDYKVILAPEAFFSLDSPYELDFNEIGNRKRNRFHVINLHRMLVFEPFNYYANMDLTADRYRVLPNRLCQIFNCVKIKDNKKQNIIGLGASIDTSVIRTEDTLWHMTLPRLMFFAERCWRNGPFENVLDPTNATTLINMTMVSYRAQLMDIEVNRFLNNFAYKESGRLDAAGYTYRVNRPGTSIYFGIPFRTPGPYPVVVKSEIPGVEVQYRSRYGNDRSWRTLFQRDPTTNRIYGGHNFTFPFLRSQPEGIDVRILSASGQRASIPTRIDGSTDSLWPRDIPTELKRGTCIPINEPPVLEDVTAAQWSRILSNIPVVQQDDMVFMQNRAVELENTFRTYQRALRPRSPLRALTIDAVFERIEMMLRNDENITTRASTDIFRGMFNKEREIMGRRERSLLARVERMQREYLQCPGVNNNQSGGNNRPGSRPNNRPGNIPGSRPRNNPGNRPGNRQANSMAANSARGPGRSG